MCFFPAFREKIGIVMLSQVLIAYIVVVPTHDERGKKNRKRNLN
jgi:hypothetical protein